MYFKTPISNIHTSGFNNPGTGRYSSSSNIYKHSKYAYILAFDGGKFLLSIVQLKSHYCHWKYCPDYLCL